MKKLIGIFLIVIGVVVFIFWGYSLFNTFFQQDILKSQLEQQLIAQGLPDDQIEMSVDFFEKTMNTWKIVSSVIVIIGIGMTFGGFVLFKRGKKDFQIVKRDAIILSLFGVVLVIISQTVDALKYHISNDKESLYYLVLFLGLLFIIVSGIYYAYSISKEKKSV